MSKEQDIEKRISALEETVAELVRKLKPPESQQDWLQSISGSMRKFPEFEEVVKLGREFRESQICPDDETM